MTDAGERDRAAPAPPPPPGRAVRLVYDGAFIGPMLPPVLPARGMTASGVPTAPVTDDVLAIPLGTRALVAQALDLLTRPDAGLRSASFYIGFILLLTVAPAVMLIGLVASMDIQAFDGRGSSDLAAPITFTFLVAVAGYVAAGVESRALATAVIGGRAEGRPLRLRESIAIARRRFWRVLLANLVVGFTTNAIVLAAQGSLGLAFGRAEAINYGVGLIAGTIVGAPFAYVTAGIVLGEVGTFEAIQRSFRLAGARKRLAVVVAAFSILSQFIVLFGLSAGADVVGRLAAGSGVLDAFPSILVIPLAAILVFAFGTLLFLVEAITAAPAVYAFEALTHYTHGLQAGRDEPASGARPWDPWLTPGLAIASLVALLSLVAGIASVPGS